MNIFKPKPLQSVECGGFLVEFYYKEGNLNGTYMDISTASGVWSMRIMGNTFTYGYLLEAAHQGLTEQIHGYAATLYILSQQMTQDQGLVDDITKSINKWQRRMDKKAEAEAKKHTKTDEQISQSVMESIISGHDSEQFKEDVRTILKEQNPYDEV